MTLQREMADSTSSRVSAEALLAATAITRPHNRTSFAILTLSPPGICPPACALRYRVWGRFESKSMASHTPDISDLFSRAMALHQEGETREAMQLCRRV